MNSLKLLCSLLILSASTAFGAEMKDWTFLVYLNGNNNLDQFGTLNLNQMEKIGSTGKVNVVVQWASYSRGTVQRVLVTKDNDPEKVTSPVIQDLGKVDMGDWRNLVDFVKWGSENFPAKHYFINIWNHGAGWHRFTASLKGNGPVIMPSDISWDDFSHNHITTEQLGDAMKESARIIGHKVDLYGSDACLMAMAEVADEMSDSVEYFAGSEEVEPGAGWPYTELLEGWNKKDSASARDVAGILTDAYVNSYNGGSNGSMDVTFSAFDLSKIDALGSSMIAFGDHVKAMSIKEKQQIVSAAQGTQNYTYSDYGDLSDFIAQVEKQKVQGLGADVLANVQEAVGQFVAFNRTTSQFERSKGVAIWLPTDKYTLDNYGKRYKGLKWHARTGWGTVLEQLLQ